MAKSKKKKEGQKYKTPHDGYLSQSNLHFTKTSLKPFSMHQTACKSLCKEVLPAARRFIND
jgi:hypothetical protein